MSGKVFEKRKRLFSIYKEKLAKCGKVFQADDPTKPSTHWIIIIMADWSDALDMVHRLCYKSIRPESDQGSIDYTHSCMLLELSEALDRESLLEQLRNCTRVLARSPKWLKAAEDFFDFSFISEGCDKCNCEGGSEKIRKRLASDSRRFIEDKLWKSDVACTSVI